jgi:hypothetical protein
MSLSNRHMHSWLYLTKLSEHLDFTNVSWEFGAVWNEFLGAFAKLRNAIISFVILICPSARM